jgi:hypothetical protein
VDDLKARAADADQDRRARLNERLRQAFIEGAEEDSRRRLGRGLVTEELERVLWRSLPGARRMLHCGLGYATVRS